MILAAHLCVSARQRATREPLDRYVKPVVAELVGTFAFFFIGAGAIVDNSYLTAQRQPGFGLIGVALAHGLILAS